MTTDQLATPQPLAAVSVDAVAVIGDWDRDIVWAEAMLRACARAGITTLLHVGDFSIWPGAVGESWLRHLHKALASHDQTILVTPGNHEDFDQIAACPVVDRGDGFGGVHWFTRRIGVLPRGHRFTLRTGSGTTRTVVSLGGGPSLDAETRTHGINWWPQEAITWRDVEDTVAGGHADIMIGHDSPGIPYCVDSVEAIVRDNDMGWSHKALLYAAEQRMLMSHAFEGVAPKLFLHGHYHVRGRKVVDLSHLGVDGAGAEGEVVSLPMQKHAANTVKVDLDTLEVTSLTNPAGF